MSSETRTGRSQSAPAPGPLFSLAAKVNMPDEKSISRPISDPLLNILVMAVDQITQEQDLVTSASSQPMSPDQPQSIVTTILSSDHSCGPAEDFDNTTPRKANPITSVANPKTSQSKKRKAPPSKQLPPPKKCKSPYSFFSMHKKHLVMKHLSPPVTSDEHKNSSESGVISSKLRLLWKNLALEEKQFYLILAEDDKHRYRTEKATYLQMVQSQSDSTKHTPNIKPRRKKKDPNAPKRSMSAFLIYAKEYRQTVMKEFPDFKFQDVSRKLAEKWKLASEEVKAPILMEEELQRKKYFKDIKEYNANKKKVEEEGLECGESVISREDDESSTYSNSNTSTDTSQSQHDNIGDNSKSVAVIASNHDLLFCHEEIIDDEKDFGDSSSYATLNAYEEEQNESHHEEELFSQVSEDTSILYPYARTLAELGEEDHPPTHTSTISTTDIVTSSRSSNTPPRKKRKYTRRTALVETPLTKPKRRKKDKNAPKRPTSAFLLFSQKKRPLLKIELPDMKFQDVSTYLSDIWKNMAPSEKQHWLDKYSEGRDRYMEEMRVYRELKEKEKLHMCPCNNVSELTLIQ